MIAITDSEVAAFTPMTQRHDPRTATSILVGELETSPFHLQADAFAGRLQEQGLNVAQGRLERRNHMDSVRDLGAYGTPAGDCLMGVIEMARR